MVACCCGSMRFLSVWCQRNFEETRMSVFGFDSQFYLDRNLGRAFRDLSSGSRREISLAKQKEIKHNSRRYQRLWLPLYSDFSFSFDFTPKKSERTIREPIGQSNYLVAGMNWCVFIRNFVLFRFFRSVLENDEDRFVLHRKTTDEIGNEIL